MAKMIIDGNEFVVEKMARMSRTAIQQITMAGAHAAEERMKANTEARRHVRNGDMVGSIGNNGYREFYGGGATDVYPLGEDQKGVRNATKAYVINYGKGRRPETKRKKRNRTGDHFITGDEKNTEAAVRQAMQAESDRLSEEYDKE
jgi:hypothetical protein